MKFSIIVPVYNAASYLERLIESVLKQTYSDYELILVDDGSTDDSFSLMKKYQKEDQRIKIFSKDNTGPGMTRKYGYEKATGDLLFFVDSDDWVSSPTSLERIHDIFMYYPEVDVLFFDREDIIGDQKSIILGFREMTRGVYSIASLKEEVRPGLGAKVFKRDIMQSDMFYESNVFEDLYTTFAYLEKCTWFYYEPTVFYSIYHDKNSESLSSNVDANMFNKSLEMALLIYNRTKSSSLKYSLELRMTTLFTSYWRYKLKKKREFTAPEIKNNVQKIVMILWNNRVLIKPNNKKELKIAIYLFLLMVSKVYI